MCGYVVVLCVILIDRPSSTGCVFLMIRRPPRSTLDRSSAASDVYKRQGEFHGCGRREVVDLVEPWDRGDVGLGAGGDEVRYLSLIHISEPTRPY